MKDMTEFEIQVIAEAVAPKTNDRTTTIVFQDGTIDSVTESWLGYSNIWLVIQGKADATELYKQLLLSYNEIRFCDGR